MLPGLEPGDRLLVLRYSPARVGDVVAVADPRLPTRTMVKRVASRGPQGITLLGDNAPASTDSRILGRSRTPRFAAGPSTATSLPGDEGSCSLSSDVD